jgi:hypothetical protein
MLIIAREMLVKRLLELHALATSYADLDPQFSDRVSVWLRGTEQTLLRLRDPMAGFVSVQRSKLLAAKDGYREPGAHAEHVSQRKLERVAAVLAMGEVQAAVQKIVSEIDARLDGLREKMVQLLAVASATNPLPLQNGQSRDEWLRNVWQTVGTSPETRGMFNYLNAATTQNDVIQLLGDVLANLIGGAASVSASSVTDNMS